MQQLPQKSRAKRTNFIRIYLDPESYRNERRTARAPSFAFLQLAEGKRQEIAYFCKSVKLLFPCRLFSRFTRFTCFFFIFFAANNSTLVHLKRSFTSHPLKFTESHESRHISACDKSYHCEGFPLRSAFLIYCRMCSKKWILKR